jgi:hypothetical protein
MGHPKGNLTRRHKIVLLLVLVLPLLVALGKCSFMPTSQWLRATLTLDDLPVGMHSRLLYVLTVPLGAILVVFCRLTLGIRLLGPFRSILLALSFSITGIWTGLVFVAVIVGTITGIRPTLRAMKLPYFARLSVILSVVSVVIIGTIVLGCRLHGRSLSYFVGELHPSELKNVAFFPIFVLCLVGDAFARIMSKEGLRSALWRAATTVLLGMVLTWLFMAPGLERLLLTCPELMITQIGLIVVIAEYYDLRLLRWLNPGADDDENDAYPAPPRQSGSDKIELAA